MKWNLLVFLLAAITALYLIFQVEPLVLGFELSLVAWIGGWFASDQWNRR